MPFQDERLLDPPSASPQSIFRGSLLIITLSACVLIVISVIFYLLYANENLEVIFVESVDMPINSNTPQREHEAAPATIRQSIEKHSNSCNLVATKPIREKKKAVYRWVDEKGITHFSDSLPSINQTDIKLDRVITRRDAFSVEVKNLNASIPPYLKDRVSQSAKRIYEFLSVPLKPDEIKKSEIVVNLLGNHTAFINAYGLLNVGRKAPEGFYTTRTNEAYVHAKGSPERVQAIAIHEASHLILTTLYQRTPLWLNEGLAEYFEVLPTSAINTKYQPKPEWIRSLRRDGLMPFELLFNVTPERWRSMKPEVSYANAWAVVYFLMQTPERKDVLRTLLRSIKDNPCTPISSLKTMEAVYRGGLRALRADIIEWLKGV